VPVRLRRSDIVGSGANEWSLLCTEGRDFLSPNILIYFVSWFVSSYKPQKDRKVKPYYVFVTI
jgi:hypothetical protein